MIPAQHWTLQSFPNFKLIHIFSNCIISVLFSLKNPKFQGQLFCLFFFFFIQLYNVEWPWIDPKLSFWNAWVNNNRFSYFCHGLFDSMDDWLRRDLLHYMDSSCANELCFSNSWWSFGLGSSSYRILNFEFFQFIKMFEFQS